MTCNELIALLCIYRGSDTNETGYLEKKGLVKDGNLTKKGEKLAEVLITIGKMCAD